MRMLVVLLAAASVAGCEAPPEGDAAAPGTLFSEQQRDLSSLFNAGENGLEVRQWVLEATPEAVASVLMRFRDGEAMDQPTREALERNGLRVVRVPLEELESMLGELGVPSRHIRTWFGQVTTWRDVLTSPVDETSRALVVSGRVRRFADGNYSLMLRSWTLMMEDGPRMELEMIPRHDRPEVSNTVPLLGAKRTAETWLHAVRAEMLLESGYAYVMVYESPSVVWREPGEGESVRVAPGSDGGGRGPGVGPDDVGPYHATGLSAIAPPTVGEVLLGRESGKPRRHLLAFVPKIPERFQPTDGALANR